MPAITDREITFFSSFFSLLEVGSGRETFCPALPAVFFSQRAPAETRLRHAYRQII
jgi:hypothetical protein